jgi:hypothetical protein
VQWQVVLFWAFVRNYGLNAVIDNIIGDVARIHHWHASRDVRDHPH